MGTVKDTTPRSGEVFLSWRNKAWDTGEERGLLVNLAMSHLAADLWGALKDNSHAQLKHLLESGVDVSAATKPDGWSLLHDAAYLKGNYRMVKLLLQHNADANAKVSKTNWTPLHSAAMSNDRVLVEELLKHGANLSVKATKKGIQEGAELTPKELAEATGFRHINVFARGDEDQKEESEVRKEENEARKEENEARKEESEAPKKADNHKLGKQSINLGRTECNIDEIKVKVTKQDTGQNEGGMMEVFLAFLYTYFPNYEKDHLKFPRAFTYDEKKIGGAHGPLDASGRDAGNQKGKDRKKAILGQKGEEILDDTLHWAFQKRTSLMWNGFERDKLFKIAKDCIKFKLNEAKALDESLLEVPLLPEERELQKLFGVDASKLENDVKEFVKELFSGKEEMNSAGLDKALKEKCVNPTKLNRENPGSDKRPFFDKLDGRDQTNYAENLRKHVKKAFEPSKKKGKKDKDSARKQVKVEEFGNYLVRYFLVLIGKHAEFDHVLVDKESSTFIHVEVKTYPQNEQITKEGLKRVLDCAKEQHVQGDALFNNVLGPAARLSPGWTKINLLAFPSVPNREVFKDTNFVDAPIADDFLRYILTKEELELEDDQWLADVQLGTKTAATDEYERLLAIIIGSSHVSYSSQVFDYQKEIRDVLGRLIGDANGITGIPLPLPDQLDAQGLQKKPLGHIQNIIFWNGEQMELLNDLKNTKSLVLCGDYGGGKTSVMVSAAQKAALDGFKVFVITTTSFEETVDTGYILDVAMKEKFREMNNGNVDIEVVSLMEIRKQLKLGFNSSITDLIAKFMQNIGDSEKVKVYFDEFPVSKNDLEAVRQNKDGDLIKMLKAIDENSCQAYVSLKTTCLLDTIFAPGPKTPELKEVGVNIDTNRLQTHIEERTDYKVKVLSFRMRNASRIGRAVVENMQEYAVKKEGSFPVACVLKPGISNHTVPGERPHCLVGEIGFNNPRMENIAMCLNYTLTELLHLDRLPAGNLPPHIVILCGDSIPPREVWKTIDYLDIQPCLYDGGVEAYRYATAHHYDTSSENPSNDEFSPTRQRPNLLQWLAGKGGILVTHNRLFAGMESPTVILITKTLGTNETAVRSGMLRAVAKLIVISHIRDAKLKAIEKHFDVIEVPDYDKI